MKTFMNQCFEVLDSNYKLEKVIVQETKINMYRVIDDFYVVFIEEELKKNSIPNVLSNIEKIYKSFLFSGMYVLIIGKTLDYIKRKDCLYCYDFNCYVDLFLLNENDNKIITDASINFGGPNFRPIIKVLLKSIIL